MLVFFVSLLITVAIAPLVSRLMHARGVIDVPNHRSSHSQPIPRGGGVACFFGIAVALAVVAFRHHDAPWLVLAAVGVLALVGLTDDHRSLSAIVRLAAQVSAGAVMGILVGGGWWIGIGVVAIPLVVNVVNFMDGINGITSLSMAVWGATALILGRTQDVPSLSLLGALTAGAALGFLPWNAPTARLFLGDSGSYLFGAIAAAGMLIGWSAGVPKVLIAAPLTIYLVDTLTVLAKRACRGDSLFVAHREHVYQRLVNDVGLSHATVSVTVAVLSLGITVAWLPGSALFGVSVTAAVVAAYLVAPRVLARRSATVRNGARKVEEQ